MKAPAITDRRRGGGACRADSSGCRPLPLAGRTVAVTRARAQASELARRLEDARRKRRAGADDPHRAAARDRPLDPTPYDLICLTSPNGVELPVRASGTAAARARRSLARRRPDRGDRPGHGTRARRARDRCRRGARALRGRVAGGGACAIRGERALVARASEARDVLPDALRARGAQVDVLALYETFAEPLSERTLARARAADYVTFTSSSTVRFFLQASQESHDGTSSDRTGGLSPQTRVVSIGPVTSATLARAWARAACRGRAPRHRRARARRCWRTRDAMTESADSAAADSEHRHEPARLGSPRLHLRRTDSTNERARAAGDRRRAARHAGDRRRADRRARAAGAQLGRARPAARCCARWSALARGLASAGAALADGRGGGLRRRSVRTCS